MLASWRPVFDEKDQGILHRSLLAEALDGLVDVAVFVWDEDRHYVAVNQAACTLTGLSREELIGMPVGDMTADGASPVIERTQRAPLLRGSSSFTRRDGEQVDLEWLTVHTRISHLPFMVSICWRAGSAVSDKEGSDPLPGV